MTGMATKGERQSLFFSSYYIMIKRTTMVKWYRYLYVGTRMEKKKKRCMCCVEEGRRLNGIYLVTLSVREGDQLEILAARELYQPSAKDRLTLIVGLAADYGEAMDILYRIIDDAEAAGMRGRLREFIEKQEGIQKTSC